MRKYYQFSRKHFEYCIRGFLIENKLGFLRDITDEWIEEHNKTWERIYSISTKNRAVDIIVFSSLDLSTNHVRSNGEDAVRLVLRWKTKNGFVFKKISKHLRIETLFKNIEKSVKNMSANVFNLNYQEFSEESSSLY